MTFVKNAVDCNQHMNNLDSIKDDISLKLFGRSRTLAIAGAQCVACGESATKFRDELSRREYAISSLCQKCQDQFFCEDCHDEA